MSTTTAEPKAAGLPDGLHHRRGVEFLAAARLETIHVQQDRIRAAQPGSYYLSSEWQRLDEEAQRICAVAGW
jgi:hypothetical protein